MKKFLSAAFAAALVTVVPLAAATSAQAGGYCYHHRVVHHGHGHGGSGVVWGIIGCAGGVVVAAIAANARDHRELTAQEAWGCGLPFWFSAPNTQSATISVRG